MRCSRELQLCPEYSFGLLQPIFHLHINSDIESIGAYLIIVLF